jgi:hypothetical protein
MKFTVLVLERTSSESYGSVLAPRRQEPKEK